MEPKFIKILTTSTLINNIWETSKPNESGRSQKSKIFVTKFRTEEKNMLAFWLRICEINQIFKF